MIFLRSFQLIHGEQFILTVGIVISCFVFPTLFILCKVHGVPRLDISTTQAFRIMRKRRRNTSGGWWKSPSSPQFQLRLSLEPSVLFQPFASLCFHCRIKIIHGEAIVAGKEIDTGNCHHNCHYDQNKSLRTNPPEPEILHAASRAFQNLRFRKEQAVTVTAIPFQPICGWQGKRNQPDTARRHRTSAIGLTFLRTGS